MTTTTSPTNTESLAKHIENSDKSFINETLTNPSIELNITEWRTMLMQFTKGLKSGEISPASANAFANLMGKGLSSYKLQLEYAKAVGRTPNIPALAPSAKEQTLVNAKRQAP